MDDLFDENLIDASTMHELMEVLGKNEYEVEEWLEEAKQRDEELVKWIMEEAKQRRKREKEEKAAAEVKRQAEKRRMIPLIIVTVFVLSHVVLWLSIKEQDGWLSIYLRDYFVYILLFGLPLLYDFVKPRIKLMIGRIRVALTPPARH